MRIFRMLFECLTPLHCGGGEEDLLQDQPVNRDAFGFWRIPGSSLAGALRSLSERLDPAMTRQLFGQTENAGHTPSPSLVWCEDALLIDFDGRPALSSALEGKEIQLPSGPFIRDHVRLDLDKDSAVEGGKFDAEIVPAGTRFFLEFRCDGWNRPLNVEENAHFDRLCALVLGGMLELGGKLGNGYGRYRPLEHSYCELDLAKPDDMAKWLNLPRSAILSNVGRRIELAPENSGMGSDGLTGNLEFDLICDTPILIAGGQPARGDGRISEADMLFALSPYMDYSQKKLVWRPVVPGSSLKGVLRHGVYRILRDRGLTREQAERRLGSIFGFVNGSKARAVRLLVSDALLGDMAQERFIQHVAIDRFTGGAVDGALFSEEPVWREKLSLPLRIRLTSCDAADAGLIFQLLLDLGQGLLSVGNGRNRGNGRVRASQSVDCASILASMSGNLAWNGQALLSGTGQQRLDALSALAPEWDTAFDKEQNA